MVFDMTVAQVVSLSELLQEVGISEQQLNTRVSDEHLKQISLFLTSWTTLAPFLGLDQSNVEAIEAEGRGEEDKRLKMLQRWENEYAFKATYRKLVDALLNLRMASHAEKVCRLLQPETASSGSESEAEVKAKAPRRENETVESLQADLLSKIRECETLKGERVSLHSRVEELQSELSTKTEQNDTLKMENETLQTQLSTKTQENEALSKEIETLQSEKRQDGSEIFSLRAEIGRLKREVQKLSVHQERESSESPTGLSPRTRLQWRRGADAPEKIGEAQAVVMGEKVYVSSSFKVFQYDWRRDTWSTLRDCPVRRFGMAQFLGRLITVGGEDRQYPSPVTGKVYLLNAQQWEEFSSPMPTARCGLTVATRTSSSSNPPAIVACGGYAHPQTVGKNMSFTHYQRVNTVEVYSHASSQWHTAKPLPIPCCEITSVTINDACYLLGGLDNNTEFGTKCCFSVSLNSLIDDATSPRSQLDDPIWMSVPDTPLTHSTAASLRGSLIAVGGLNDNTLTVSAAIHVLTSDGSWERVRGGDLPKPCRSSITVCLPSGELLVAGGIDRDGRKKTFIAYIFD